MALHGLGRIFLRRRWCSDVLAPLSTSRPFSSTLQRARTIPRFLPSSSLELDDLFMTFRTEIFIPEIVSQLHRDLIYKPSRHIVLTGDPGVTVTMSDGEELKLQPMNQRLRPSKKISLQRLLELMQDSKDWNNLPAFLEGMRLAGERLPLGFMERFVRKAQEHSMTRIIIRCAEMVNKTGVTLADPVIVKELMLGIHCSAAKSGFQGAPYTKSVRQAQEVAMLLERREHCEAKTSNEGRQDMRGNITMQGIFLELRAAQPDHTDGWMSFDTVPKMAARILALWPEQGFQVPEDGSRVRIELETWLPLWAGIKFALKVKEVRQSALRPALVEARDSLAASVEKARALVEAASKGHPRRCLQMYNDVKDV